MSKHKSRLRKDVRRNVTTTNAKTRSRIQLNDCRRNPKNHIKLKENSKEHQLKQFILLINIVIQSRLLTNVSILDTLCNILDFENVSVFFEITTN